MEIVGGAPKSQKAIAELRRDGQMASDRRQVAVKAGEGYWLPGKTVGLDGRADRLQPAQDGQVLVRVRLTGCGVALQKLLHPPAS